MTILCLTWQYEEPGTYALASKVIDISGIDTTKFVSQFEAEWVRESKPLKTLFKKLSRKRNKARYAKPIAEAITGMADERLRFPALIRSLFERMSDDLGLPKREVPAP